MFRVGFLGRGNLGLRVLEDLLAHRGIEVPVIVSCGATPEVEDTSSEMQAMAANRGIDYFTANQINKPEWAARLTRYHLDLAVAMLWLHTLDEHILATARIGFLNCHGGHLPKYRGNACANWAILNGEPFIGATTHLMEPNSLDSGPVLHQDIAPITPETTIGKLIGELEEKGRRLVLQSVEALRTGTVVPKPQNVEEASYCYPRIPRDGEIDWGREALAIDRLIRASGKPYPGAYSWFMDHRSGGTIRKLTVWRAHIQRHPLNEHYAVPGHVLRHQDGAKCAIACGDRMLLVLDEIEIDGIAIEPAAAFRTVRQRLGLDLSLLAARANGWNLAPEG